MEHIEGRLWRHSNRRGQWVYVYRRVVSSEFFENGVRKIKDVRRSLGRSLERAQDRARRLDVELEAWAHGEEPRREALLAEFVARYVAHLKDERRSRGWENAARHAGMFLRHVGNRPVRGVVGRDVEGFLAQRRLTVRPTTANAALKDVRRMFNVALDWGLADGNPAARVKPIPAKPLPVKVPTAEEVARLLAVLRVRKPWLNRLVLVMIATGCRPGEALGLTWADVEMTRGILTLRRSKVEDSITFDLKGPLKDVLWQAWTEAGMPTEGLVFLSRNGRAFTRTGVLTVLKREAKALGWPWLCLRTFRKLAARTVVAATGDIRKAQHLLGHTSYRTTEVYLGRGEKARGEAVDVMAAYLDRAVGRIPGSSENEGLPEASRKIEKVIGE